MTLHSPVFVAPRRSERQDVHYPARVRFAGAPAIGCTIREVSAMGALIDFRVPQSVPVTFHLIIPDQLFEADCAVRHRRDTKVEVLFTSCRREALARFG